MGSVIVVAGASGAWPAGLPMQRTAFPRPPEAHARLSLRGGPRSPRLGFHMTSTALRLRFQAARVVTVDDERIQ